MKPEVSVLLEIPVSSETFVSEMAVSELISELVFIEFSENHLVIIFFQLRTHESHVSVGIVSARSPTRSYTWTD